MSDAQTFNETMSCLGLDIQKEEQDDEGYVKSATREIFEAIRDRCLDNPRLLEDLVFEVSADTGYSSETVNTIIDRMEQDGLIFQVGNKMEALNYE